MFCVRFQPAMPPVPVIPSAQQQLLDKQRKMADLQASIAARMARNALPNVPNIPELLLPDDEPIDINAATSAAQ